MSDTEEGREPEYAPPAIEARGSLNHLTQGGSLAGNLDADYPVGTSSSYGGGLFSPAS